MSIQVHRNGDSRICGANTRVIGQSTVFANGLLISVEGDPNTDGHGELIATNGSVYIEGKKIIVTGDNAFSDDKAPDDGQSHFNPRTSTGSSDVSAF